VRWLFLFVAVACFASAISHFNQQDFILGIVGFFLAAANIENFIRNKDRGLW